MDIMGSAILFVVFIIVFNLIVETFTVLFRLTGLTQEKARTQVISLLTNSGFTTAESEMILHSRKRRKLAQLTMLFGYSFTATVVSIVINIFFTLSRTEVKSMVVVVVALALVLTALFLFFRIRAVKDFLDHVIEKIGNRVMFGKKSNILVLIDQYGGRAMAEIFLEFVPAILDQTPLADSRLKETYDIQILLLKQDGKTSGTVDGKTIVRSGDIVVVFGNYKNIRTLFERPEAFEAEH